MSGDDGGFTLPNVPPEPFYIDAYNESLGCPYGFFSFFNINRGRPLIVTVESSRQVDKVVLMLGPKAPYLRIEGSVLNQRRHNGWEINCAHA